jgi:hypothetical protein
MLNSTIFSTVLRSAFFYSTQSFCNLVNHFATVLSYFAVVNSSICYNAQLFFYSAQPFCYSARSFYDFVSHSRDPVRHFTTVLAGRKAAHGLIEWRGGGGLRLGHACTDRSWVWERTGGHWVSRSVVGLLNLGDE